MSFAAVVPCPAGAGCLGVPFENRELRISALNHKPVNRIAGYQSANFTPEFLNRCHKLSIVKPLVLLLSHCSVHLPPSDFRSMHNEIGVLGVPGDEFLHVWTHNIYLQMVLAGPL